MWLIHLILLNIILIFVDLEFLFSCWVRFRFGLCYKVSRLSRGSAVVLLVTWNLWIILAIRLRSSATTFFGFVAPFAFLTSHATELYFTEFALFAWENWAFIVCLHVGAEGFFLVFFVSTSLGLREEPQIEVVPSNSICTENSYRIQECHIHQGKRQ